MAPTRGTSWRGEVRREKRIMPDEAARAFLRRAEVAHVATVGSDGCPYVIPLVYVYEGGDVLYLHTGGQPGHFLTNVQQEPRVCLAVSEQGPLLPGEPHACNSALVYRSVVVFGRLRIVEEGDKKTWFFDQLLEKYGDLGWSFEPGYPALERIVLYEMQVELLTGKQSEGLYH